MEEVGVLASFRYLMRMGFGHRSRPVECASLTTPCCVRGRYKRATFPLTSPPNATASRYRCCLLPACRLREVLFWGFRLRTSSNTFIAEWVAEVVNDAECRRVARRVFVLSTLPPSPTRLPPPLAIALPQCPAHVVVVGRVVAPTPPPCTRSVGSMRTGPRPAGDATWRLCSDHRWKSCSRGHLRRCGDGRLLDVELAACSV